MGVMIDNSVSIKKEIYRIRKVCLVVRNDSIRFWPINDNGRLIAKKEDIVG